ncbi:MAG: divalent cation tolerance protein CutA [Actinobacteria bacterium]|nr:divalent cation tolerance protein CutA [Actinomycetota bacterium]
MADEYIQVFTTTDSRDEADRLAALTVGERLAACVQVTSIDSTYWWEGQVESSKEFLLTMKTTRKLFDDLASRIREEHSYDVPEITGLPITIGSAEYLSWISAETGVLAKRR